MSLRPVRAGVSGTWVPRPGRQFHWAPDWDDGDASLVFDAASGDYWVLSRAAADALRRVAGQAAADAAGADGEELLTELQQHGLVVRMA